LVSAAVLLTFNRMDAETTACSRNVSTGCNTQLLHAVQLQVNHENRMAVGSGVIGFDGLAPVMGSSISFDCPREGVELDD
jgi:hypothetical protein